MPSIRRLALVTALVVTGGTAGGVVAYRVADRSPGAAAPSPSISLPSPVPSPTLQSFPTRTPAPLAATPAPGAAPSAGGVARVLAARLADAALGSRVNALVVDATTGSALYGRGADLAAIPASTTKVFTATAALHALGPDRRFTTRVVSSATPANGVLDGDLVVVGGGDPTLTADPTPTTYPRPATLASLARAVRKSGVTRVTGALVVDTSLFTGPGLAPGWKATYVSEGSVSPITAFMVDGGRVRIDDDDRNSRADLAGMVKFRNALRTAGVKVGDTIKRGTAPSTATDLATVTSPPLSALVERMLVRSDNELAESLARHVAIERGVTPDFSGVATALPAEMRELGVDPPTLYDGSGLSRLDRVTPAQLVAALSAASRDPRLQPVVTGLPVAAFSGTLSGRYDKPPSSSAAGKVRAKTGSLDNVATLAGVIETASGRLLVFAFTADRLPTRFVSKAARALDAAAAALAACGCR